MLDFLFKLEQFCQQHFNRRIYRLTIKQLMFNGIGTQNIFKLLVAEMLVNYYNACPQILNSSAGNFF